MRATTRWMLTRLARFNAKHPWSHNDAYTPWVLRQARAVRRGGGSRALDVGCGTGNLLRPGGRLVIVGLARETPADAPWSRASLLLNPVIGALRHPRRARETPDSMTAPTAEPRDTFDEIASAARAELPGVRMRRALFWRYTAVWVAPPAR